MNFTSYSRKSINAIMGGVVGDASNASHTTLFTVSTNTSNSSDSGAFDSGNA
jgi:hypothetical protein